MSPSVLWFSLVLILYGEGSLCEHTRRCARAILYSYLLTLVLSSNINDLQISIMTVYIVICVGYGYCIATSDRIAGKVLFGTLIVLMSYISTALIFHTIDYDIIVNGYSLLEHSAYVYREGSLIALGCVSFLTLHDKRVHIRENIISFIAMVTWLV